MSEKTQLTRITVPAITDARYIEGLSDAFNKINDNFKKIASLPFLQGVQGDSYQLEEYKIWNDDWTITEDGKVLLDSIFGKDVTVDGVVFDSIRDYIGEKLDGVSPLDFFITEDGNTIINNALYFYVIKDDTGNVIEKQLGQYYYFVDGRLKNIGNVYNGEISGVSLDGFNDYTGFYQYRYNPKSYNQKYLKVEILPSIYYDQDKNDICWKFNGNETGISAIGVKGADGKDADLLIVKATANESDCVGTVEAVINPIGANNSTEQWIDNPEDFKEGKALICIQRSGIAQDFAYGQVIKVNGVFNAYWEPNYVFSKLIGDNRITNYFYNMGGEDETATAPFYLAIPSYSNRSPSGDIELKKCAHVIDGKNISDGSNLRIFYSEKVFDENGNQQWNPMPTDDSVGTAGTLDIENYNVNIGKRLRVISGGYISGSLGVEDGLQVHTGQLTVSENVQISGSLGVDNRITVGYGNDDSINISTGALVVSGGIGVSKSVNIGKNLTIEESLKVKGNSGATNERNADVVIYGGVGIGKDVIIGSSGKMKIKNGGVVYKSDNTIKIDDAALNVNGDIYSDENIIAKNKSEGLYSVLTGANDSNIARGVSGLKALVEANNEGTIFSGGGTQAAIGSTNGLNRTVYNRTALQSYHTKLKDSSKSYETLEYHINPCGGQVLVNKYAGHGGTGNTLSVSNALVVDGGLYARTKKPTTVSDKDSGGPANGLSNVLIGHNDPGNSQFEDFPKDLDKGGYPLVIKSLQSNGSVTGGAMVFGVGDIYALSGNNTTGWSSGTLCLNHRTRYRGDVQIGRNLNVGDNTLGGNITINSTDDSNGRLIVKGTTSSTSKNTGALVVTGGVGIGGAVNIGGKITGQSGIKVYGGASEFYSGTGATTDANYLKVGATGVTVGGSVGKLDVTGALWCGGSFSVESESSSFGGDIHMEDGGELTAYLDNVDSIKVVSKEIVCNDSFVAKNIDSHYGGYKLSMDETGLSFVEQLSDDEQDFKNILSADTTNIKLGDYDTPIDTIYLNANSVSSQTCNISISDGTVACGTLEANGIKKLSVGGNWNSSSPATGSSVTTNIYTNIYNYWLKISSNSDLTLNVNKDLSFCFVNIWVDCTENTQKTLRIKIKSGDNTGYYLNFVASGDNSLSNYMYVDNTTGTGKLEYGLVHLQLVNSDNENRFIASGSYIDKRKSGFIF